MNRSQRRMKARKNKNAENDIKKSILRQAEKQLNDGRVEAMMMCFALAMHRELGFGKERCLRMLGAVDMLMDPWIRCECDLETLRQWVIDEVGIDVKCG